MQRRFMSYNALKSMNCLKIQTAEKIKLENVKRQCKIIKFNYSIDESSFCL
jgi:hypothetical protein